MTSARFPRLFLALCFAFSLAACDSTESTDNGNGPGTTLGNGTVSITGEINTSVDGGAIFYTYENGGLGLTIADVDFTTIEGDGDLPGEYLQVETSVPSDVGTITINREDNVYVEYNRPEGDLYATSGTIDITAATDERVVGTITAEVRRSSALETVAGQMTASFEALRLPAE
jgi:hypothetical protein